MVNDITQMVNDITRMVDDITRMVITRSTGGGPGTGGGHYAEQWSLHGGATCAVIEVLVDHDNGVLSYRVNGGPVLEALKGFPKDATGQLRPWVGPALHPPPGRVRFKIPYLSRVP